ncbi:hypothetical protein Tcan_15580 [Toxocara canis]|uniref:Uncharacterized protein n=1 Tax=Toxocara canis TaxID=6265 RepID=A0A0B2VHQ0_TOXCA|nr:hypothetical protein Tcan_15580 [Toxocara canis]
MDCSEPASKEDGDKNGAPMFGRNTSHCSAPSSSPRSSPVDPQLLPEFDTHDDSYGSYHHTTYCDAIHNSHFEDNQ